jgi:hypothetical protein
MSLISRQKKPNRCLVVSVLSVGLLGMSWGRVAADNLTAFGDALPGLTAAEQQAYEEGREEFMEEERAEDGLGPVFNATSCVACHSSPAVGGDSTVVETRFGTYDRKQFDPLLSGGGSLIQTNGIGWTKDGCEFVGETVTDKASIVAGRKTTPLFGLGLIEAIPDSALHQLAARQPQAIKGRVHQVKDVGQPTRPGRFGHKAQAATLLQFSGDAYLNEMGITSPNFPRKIARTGIAASCAATL